MKSQMVKVEWEPDEYGETPSEIVTIPADLHPDDIADYLSDDFGYLVQGWQYYVL